MHLIDLSNLDEDLQMSSVGQYCSLCSGRILVGRQIAEFKLVYCGITSITLTHDCEHA